jgi:hypothetical protein
VQVGGKTGFGGSFFEGLLPIYTQQSRQDTDVYGKGGGKRVGDSGCDTDTPLQQKDACKSDTHMHGIGDERRKATRCMRCISLSGCSCTVCNNQTANCSRSTPQTANCSRSTPQRRENGHKSNAHTRRKGEQNKMNSGQESTPQRRENGRENDSHVRHVHNSEYRKKCKTKARGEGEKSISSSDENVALHRRGDACPPQPEKERKFTTAQEERIHRKFDCEQETSCFKFLSIFKFEDRKGWDVLLQAYWREFDAKDNVS